MLAKLLSWGLIDGCRNVAAGRGVRTEIPRPELLSKCHDGRVGDEMTIVTKMRPSFEPLATKKAGYLEVKWSRERVVHAAD